MKWQKQIGKDQFLKIIYHLNINTIRIGNNNFQNLMNLIQSKKQYLWPNFVIIWLIQLLISNIFL